MNTAHNPAISIPQYQNPRPARNSSICGLALCAGLVGTKLCAGCGFYWSRVVFGRPEVFWDNATKTRGGAAWLLLPTSSPPNSWGEGYGWGRVGLGRRARLKLNTHALYKVLCPPVLHITEPLSTRWIISVVLQNAINPHSVRYIRPHRYPPCSVHDKARYSRVDTSYHYKMTSAPILKLKNRIERKKSQICK